MVAFYLRRLTAVAVRPYQLSRFGRLGFRNRVAVASAHAYVVVDGDRFVSWRGDNLLDLVRLAPGVLFGVEDNVVNLKRYIF